MPNTGDQSHSPTHESHAGPAEGRTARQPGHPRRPRCPADRSGRAEPGRRALFDALKIAEDAGLDLVEIAPNSVPPVCKILDYGRFRFNEQKKQAEARKKQKTVEVKEIKLRPGIDKHDYDVKMKAVQRFFEEGDKVKVTLRFRGREMAHTRTSG